MTCFKPLKRKEGEEKLDVIKATPINLAKEENVEVKDNVDDGTESEIIANSSKKTCFSEASK